MQGNGGWGANSLVPITTPVNVLYIEKADLEGNTLGGVTGTGIITIRDCYYETGASAIGATVPLFQVVSNYPVSNVAGASLTFAAASHTITRSSGSWVREGFAAGATITVSGSASNNGTLPGLNTVTDLVLTFASGIVNEGPTSAATVSTTYAQYLNNLIIEGCRVTRFGSTGAAIILQSNAGVNAARICNNSFLHPLEGTQLCAISVANTNRLTAKGNYAPYTPIMQLNSSGYDATTVQDVGLKVEHIRFIVPSASLTNSLNLDAINLDSGAAQPMSYYPLPEAAYILGVRYWFANATPYAQAPTAGTVQVQAKAAPTTWSFNAATAIVNDGSGHIQINVPGPWANNQLVEVSGVTGSGMPAATTRTAISEVGPNGAATGFVLLGTAFSGSYSGTGQVKLITKDTLARSTVASGVSYVDSNSDAHLFTGEWLPQQTPISIGVITSGAFAAPANTNLMCEIILGTGTMGA